MPTAAASAQGLQTLALGLAEHRYIITGWAATKRLTRELRDRFSVIKLALIIDTISTALLTLGATVLIFRERFFEGAWTYFVFIPIFHALFTYFRTWTSLMKFMKP
jgi:hypothetical protein